MVSWTSARQERVKKHLFATGVSPILSWEFGLLESLAYVERYCLIHVMKPLKLSMNTLKAWKGTSDSWLLQPIFVSWQQVLKRKPTSNCPLGRSNSPVLDWNKISKSEAWWLCFLLIDIDMPSLQYNKIRWNIWMEKLQLGVWSGSTQSLFECIIKLVAPTQEWLEWWRHDTWFPAHYCHTK